SAFWPRRPVQERLRVHRGQEGVRYVTISRARQAELSRLLAIPPEDIDVITPPLDAPAWLDIGPRAREIDRRLVLERADVVVLVPAKLLPHKNLELAVQVGACLGRLTARPIVLLTGAASSHQEAISLELAEQL